MASCLDDPPLVEGQGTETAAPEASPVAHQAELYFFNSRDPAGAVIVRMPCSLVGK